MSTSRNISPPQSLPGLNPNKLRRLPHLFSRVLELPFFKSDADISISETSDCFRFVAETDGLRREFRAHTVHIHPGVLKVVITQIGALELKLDELEIDTWRFRLPETALPELVTAAFAGGKLIVTVPKTEDAGKGAWGDKKGDCLVNLARSVSIFHILKGI
ncbi:17.4 kDa class I heat shock protein-like [Cucurbita moschata]|uniref:17.4 kDa class I heat shock protein-like n=1 Tax=Cucurbita moschata TaxID=3662 RepID=A0A6J1EQ09_CUCMO|nr:17.4 kDa class I heat shock protein-like [Cucurbita moschata]